MKYNEHCFKVQTKLFFMTIKFLAPLFLFTSQQLCCHAVLDHRSFKNRFCSVSVIFCKMATHAALETRNSGKERYES